VNAHRGKHDEHPVAPGHGALDDLAVIRRSRNDSNAPLEGIELLHAARAAHADHRIAPIQRVLHHVDSELPRGPDDADLHHVRQAYSWVTPSGVSNDAPAVTLSRLSTELLSRHVLAIRACPHVLLHIPLTDFRPVNRTRRIGRDAFRRARWIIWGPNWGVRIGNERRY